MVFWAQKLYSDIVGMEPHDPPAELPEWWNETWQQGWEQFVWQHFMAKGKGKGDKGGKGETPTPMTPGSV